MRKLWVVRTVLSRVEWHCHWYDWAGNEWGKCVAYLRSSNTDTNLFKCGIDVKLHIPARNTADMTTASPIYSITCVRQTTAYLPWPLFHTQLLSRPSRLIYSAAQSANDVSERGVSSNRPIETCDSCPPPPATPGGVVSDS